MGNSNYDLIVLGVGGIGSAALFHAAKRGQRVIGLDRFSPGHDRGSSHGSTRIIRQAYFEHPDYVPLLLAAYDGWADLESRSGKRLYFRTGLLEAGPRDGVVAPGVLAADRRHGLGVETLEFAEAQRRHPAFKLDPEWLIVFEPQAGYLLVEQCVRTFAEAAVSEGAEIRADDEVREWRVSDSGVEIRYGAETLTAARMIVTAGAWAGELLTGTGPPLRVLRKHLHWYQATAPMWQAPHCPAYLFETATGCFYGFPVSDEQGAKVAEHSGGDEISDPLNDVRELDPVDCRRVDQFIRQHLRMEHPARTAHTTCFYTCTPDDHFIVDQHPEHAAVVFASGLSGHGFKFAPVLGSALVDLALEGQSELPIEFLRLARFAEG